MKLDADQLDAFGSPNAPPLASVGIHFRLNPALVRAVPHDVRLKLKDYFCPDVSILRIFPGEFTTIASTLNGLKGLVLQTFGAGNAPDNQPNFLDALKGASERGVVIVNVTQCPRGEVSAAYACGSALLECGVVPAGDMTPDCALVGARSWSAGWCRPGT